EAVEAAAVAVEAVVVVVGAANGAAGAYAPPAADAPTAPDDAKPAIASVEFLAAESASESIFNSDDSLAALPVFTESTTAAEYSAESRNSTEYDVTESSCAVSKKSESTNSESAVSEPAAAEPTAELPATDADYLAAVAESAVRSSEPVRNSAEIASKI
ncbi:unnamed protein product, partial [Laminaria digitata]